MGLFDDVLKGINQGITKIQSTSQEMMQTVSLTSRINSLEAQKTAALTNIGRLVYDKYHRLDEVSEELLKSKVREIVQWEDEIQTLKSEIDALKVQHSADASQAQKSDAMAGCQPTPGFVCPHCEAPANRDKQFCVSCGGVLKQGSECSN
jgi:phosphomevalonate kinase